MSANAVIRLSFPSESLAEIVLKALTPEVRKFPSMRSRASLEKENTYLTLRIEAKDTVALRAAVNSYLRWTNSIVTVLETLKDLS